VATHANFAQVKPEGQVTRNLEFNNLDAIISVGYRVNSRHETVTKCHVLFFQLVTRH
jgi:hypothetical protein